MPRWTPFHELPDQAKRLIFGTLTPSKMQLALHSVTQYAYPIILKGGEENEKNRVVSCFAK